MKIVHKPTDNDPEKEMEFLIYQTKLNLMTDSQLINFLINVVTEQDLYLKELLKNIMNLQKQINELKE